MEPRLVSINSLDCAGLSEYIEMPRDKEHIPSLWAKLQLRIPEITNSCGPMMGVISRSDKTGCVRYAACIQVSDTKNIPRTWTSSRYPRVSMRNSCTRALFLIYSRLAITFIDPGFRARVFSREMDQW